MRVLVTGANGFVGRALCRELRHHNWPVIAVLRREGDRTEGCETHLVEDIGPDTEWEAALAEVESVVHLAARVHVMREGTADPLAAYRHTNVDGTLQLARVAAAGTRVKRFVYVSSVKVLGKTSPNGSFTESSFPNPQDPYAISKWEAENGLAEIACGSGMDLVILRPPLVYGPGVKGSFLSLLRLVDLGLPLPLGAITNRRSLLYLGNLVDAIRLCLSRPTAPGRTFLLRDSEDLSTTELIRRLAAALGRRTALFSMPEPLLWITARCVGRRAEAERLLGSLTVDDRRIRAELAWKPPYTVNEGLAQTVAWFRTKGL